MPIHADTAALRDQIRLGLLREVYRQNLLTEAQLAQLIGRQRAR